MQWPSKIDKRKKQICTKHYK